jgi:hypothetical protein
MSIAPGSSSHLIAAVIIAAGLAFATDALAQAPRAFVYPQKGQSPQQQAQDESQCRAWAQQQAGGAPPPPQNHVRGAGRGAARGAAGGAAIGAIAGDAGKGAAIGAVAGGVRGRRGSKQAAANQQAGAADALERAYGACMQGRGYSVK